MENLPIYCGNNRLDVDVLNGLKTLGTRYKCLKKGFGTGYYVIEADRKMTLPYEPIVINNSYCGDNSVLPDGYESFGSLHNCFTKGLGAGMKKKAREVFLNEDTGLKKSVKRRKSVKKKSVKRRKRVNKKSFKRRKSVKKKTVKRRKSVKKKTVKRRKSVKKKTVKRRKSVKKK